MPSFCGWSLHLRLACCLLFFTAALRVFHGDPFLAGVIGLLLSVGCYRFLFFLLFVFRQLNRPSVMRYTANGNGYTRANRLCYFNLMVKVLPSRRTQPEVAGLAFYR